MRVITWVALNAIFLLAIWFGVIQGNDGALNLAYFMAWLTVFSGFLCMSPGLMHKIREKGRSVPAPIDIGFDFLVLGIFAWHGSFVTAAFYFIHICCVAVIYGDDNEETA